MTREEARARGKRAVEGSPGRVLGSAVPNMSLRERIEALLRMALLVFILAAAAFLSAITTMRIAIRGRQVEMPSLVGKSAREAQSLLEARGLRLKVADRVYGDMPADTVVRQSPPPGEQMKIGQDAHVVLSLGPHEVPIPTLTGKSLRTAQIELLRAGLQLGEVSSVYLPDFPADTIVQQDPPEGGKAISPRVDVLVSQGARPPAYIMPALVGLTQSDADRELAAAGLRVAKLTYLPSTQWPHGTVLEQAPAGGARIAPDTPVELQVAQ